MTKGFDERTVLSPLRPPLAFRECFCGIVLSFAIRKKATQMNYLTSILAILSEGLPHGIVPLFVQRTSDSVGRFRYVVGQ